MKKFLVFFLLALAMAIISCKSAGPETASMRAQPPVIVEESKVLDEVVVRELPASEAYKRERTTKLRSEDIEALPTKSISEIAATSAGTDAKSEGGISIGGGRGKVSYYYIDGIKVSAADALKMVPQAEIEHLHPSDLGGTPASFGNERAMKESELPAIEFVLDGELGLETDIEIEPPRTMEPELPPVAPEPGLLTAAEWNDLKNWEEWLELQESGAYQSMVDYWNLAGMKRHSVFVTNDDGFPLANQKVELISESGKVYWSAVTDNSGSAELWVSSELKENYELMTEGKKVLSDLSKSTGGYDRLKLDKPCMVESAMDIMFVVDATGSMQDEIDFLRAELRNVIGRVEDEATEDEMEIRVGTVFYKDKYDDYLTAISPLDVDLSSSIDFILGKDAGGGGDTPEAVDAALELALQQNWNEKAVNRLLFLILDAPPHHNEKVIKNLEQQIRKAAGLGIKVIPITASGIDRETEYLMKQMSVLTNGTYIFLTDDSGIGESHLEHVIPDYEVEFLNDLMVRVISGYAEVLDCDKPLVKEIVRTSDPLEMKVFPNPTSGQVTISVSEVMDRLVVTSTSGKILFAVDAPSKSEQLDLSALISGMYQASYVKGGQRVGVKQLIKI